MTFLELLDGAEILAQSGNPRIHGVEYDSRKIRPGAVFLAMRGETTDGNKFIDAAIANGAVAVVTDSPGESQRERVTWALVPHGRRALARLSANFYGQPALRLATTGITGTNGKSTTAFLIESIFKAAGRNSVLVGTIEYHLAGKVLPAPHTTPESLELNRLFAEAVDLGVSEAVMEVSSHALAQQRVFGIPYDVAVFTNLTRDHLDYHHTMDEYFAAKLILFEGSGTEPPRVAVTNLDDEYGKRIAESATRRGSRVVTYGWSQGDFRAEKVELTAQGTRFDLATPDGRLAIWTPLAGRVNVYNAMAAAAAASARGCTPTQIVEGIRDMKFVPGRFQRVECGQSFRVVVDYAHTDDALRNLTAIAREFVGTKNRVLTVFGCGGDRDRAKRPLMGEAAGRGSDFVVLTSDNPRSEDPVSIINDALVGVQHSGAKYKIEPDRRSAIRLAIQEAMPGDIVLIAGKGHEKVQIMRDGPHPFDDAQVASELLQAAGFDGSTSKAGGAA